MSRNPAFPEAVPSRVDASQLARTHRPRERQRGLYEICTGRHAGVVHVERARDTSFDGGARATPPPPPETHEEWLGRALWRDPRLERVHRKGRLDNTYARRGLDPTPLDR